jgi:hypothetical protein
MTPKKVLLVSSLNAISPANYLIAAFQDLGINVISVSDVNNKNAQIKVRGKFDVGKYLAKTAVTPDFILFVEGGDMGIFPVNYQHLGIPSFWWGIDTHNDYRKHLRISRLFDHSFIAQKSFVEKLKSDGIRSVSWLPLAYPKQKNQEIARNLDIAYVGSTDWTKYPERGLLLKAISDAHSKIFVGQATPKKMFEIYEKSKLVFNHSPMNDLNMRFFEAIGSGAVLITNPIVDNGVEDLFEKNTDFLEYSSIEELTSTLEQLLSENETIHSISSNGLKKVLENHTYHHRAEAMLNHSWNANQDNSIKSIDTSAALLSMGMISGAMNYFFLSIKKEVLGKRNRLILIVITPFFALLSWSVRVMETSLNLMRNRRW